MLVRDLKTGRLKRVSRRDANILQRLGRAVPADELHTQSAAEAAQVVGDEKDEKDELIEQLAELGIERDRRYGVKKLQAELDEARGGYKTRDMKAE